VRLPPWFRLESGGDGCIRRYVPSSLHVIDACIETLVSVVILALRTIAIWERNKLVTLCTGCALLVSNSSLHPSSVLNERWNG